MKAGNLVLPKPDAITLGVDYGVGIILERHEYPEDGLLPQAGAVSYRVRWGHETQFWHEDELILVAE